ncbi:hypothetical protein AN189_17660 [Loktanella sp. 3ANDIMAR09]|uniref:hypothetical protein n=1 Tax=Loktanella sp. 3ANDIMAR09 TaxID=1225657 RepID=UPI0006F427EF|nr:hypothetical protein [Loktanella sp. 3ANDIMAR09]KQI67049.1 hypothetical protein AN189_17660 [Loktanella sp. 3ANDIMAR09]
MKILLTVAAVMLAGAASAECRQGRADVGVAVTGWSARDDGVIVVDLENQTQRTFHAIDGHIQFYDPLGRRLPPVGLPSIGVIPPGAFQTFAMGIAGNALGKLPADQFTWDTCLKRIAYDDGTIEEFN